jgi:blue light- and temperature-responsive anti-repressor
MTMRLRIMKRTTMAGSLYRLIYCSRNVIAQAEPLASTPAGMKHEIRAILATARRCNTADNVTGALLFTASGFAQVLEGPREIVERTFERISLDPRHADVTALSFTPTERRSFPDWSMGFCSQTSLGLADPLARLLGDAAFSGRRVTTGSDVLRMLESVVQREDDWVRT